MTDFRTACSLDCPDTCSLVVTVEDDVVVAVDADPNGPNKLTAGWICAKVKHTPQLLHGQDRLTTALRRIGPKGSGQFEPVDIDEALDLFANKVRTAFEREGRASVVPYLYNSSAGKMGEAGLSNHVWEALGTARTDITICAATSGEAWGITYGDLGSADPDDLDDSQLIVVWGANPNASNSHLTAAIEARRRAGAKLVVIDPRRIPLAGRADLHLAVKPGTDVVLAMGVAHILQRDGLLDQGFIDQWVGGGDEYLAACAPWTPERVAVECGLDVADIEAFAHDYGTIKPAMLRMGWGLERNRNGGSACRAVLALPALAGQFGRPGAGVFQWVQGTNKGFDAGAIRRAVLDGHERNERRSVNMNRLGRSLVHDEGGRVEVLFVQGSNPVATCPNQALVLQGFERDDLFTVVHDLTMTDTARYADLIIPATSQFEVDEIVGSYGAPLVLDAPAVIPRVGDSLTNDEVSCGVGIRLGLDAQTWDPDPRRIRRLALGDRELPVMTRRGAAQVQFVDIVPSAKVALVVDAPGIDRLPTYRPAAAHLPITLISPATSRTISTMFGNIEPASPALRLHAEDAAERGLADGDRAAITDGTHRIEANVVIGPELRRGVASMPKGMWRKDGDGGFTVNVFCPDDLADLAGGATFNDARVDVVKV